MRVRVCVRVRVCACVFVQLVTAISSFLLFFPRTQSNTHTRPAPPLKLKTR